MQGNKSCSNSWEPQGWVVHGSVPRITVMDVGKGWSRGRDDDLSLPWASSRSVNPRSWMGRTQSRAGNLPVNTWSFGLGLRLWLLPAMALVVLLVRIRTFPAGAGPQILVAEQVFGWGGAEGPSACSGIILTLPWSCESRDKAASHGFATGFWLFPQLWLINEP